MLLRKYGVKMWGFQNSAALCKLPISERLEKFNVDDNSLKVFCSTSYRMLAPLPSFSGLEPHDLKCTIKEQYQYYKAAINNLKVSYKSIHDTAFSLLDDSEAHKKNFESYIKDKGYTHKEYLSARKDFILHCKIIDKAYFLLETIHLHYGLKEIINACIKYDDLIEDAQERPFFDVVSNGYFHTEQALDDLNDVIDSKIMLSQSLHYYQNLVSGYRRNLSRALSLRKSKSVNQIIEEAKILTSCDNKLAQLIFKILLYSLIGFNFAWIILACSDELSQIPNEEPPTPPPIFIRPQLQINGPNIAA